MKNHVADRKFAAEFDGNAFIRKLIDNIRPMSAVESHYLLNAIYNMDMGFFDHLSETKAKAEPLAVIRAFKEEDPLANSLMNDLAFRYYRNKIEKFFHIDFLEYIKLPMPVARKLDDIAINVLSKLAKEEDELTKADLQGLTGS